MTDYNANAATNSRPAVTSTGNNLTANHGVFSITAALALNDTINVCKLPAGEVPVDLVATVPELDTGTAIVLDFGILDAVGSTDDADCFIASSTVGQAGGVARMTAIEGCQLGPVNNERIVVITVTTGPTTGTTTGDIDVTLLSRQADQDD